MKICLPLSDKLILTFNEKRSTGNRSRTFENFEFQRIGGTTLLPANASVAEPMKDINLVTKPKENETNKDTKKRENIENERDRNFEKATAKGQTRNSERELQKRTV